MKRHWVRWIGCAVIAAGSVTLSCSGGGEPVPEATIVRAKEALAPLKTELMGALSSAMKEGGPQQAIGVCRVKAPEIATAVSSEAIQVGRTSHRLRNPDNAPAAWMQDLLDEYVANPADRTPRAVRLDATHVGYVEPIHVKPLCLTCHGEQIEPSLSARLHELYPGDQATGFREDDFRGLFWVKLREEKTT